MSFKRTGLLGAILAAAACSPATPSGYPDVRGTYGSPQMWQIRFTPPGQETRFSSCGGSITIERQDERALSGRFARGGSCPTLRGAMSGEIDRAGNVVFDLRADGTFQSLVDCTYVSGEHVWIGRFVGEDLTARLEVTLECATPGLPPEVVRVEADAEGSRFDE